MPDLTETAVVAWLRDREPGLASVEDLAVRPVEREGGAPAALARLGASLDGAMEQDADGLARVLGSERAAGLRSIVSQLGSARQLRLLDWVADPRLAERGGALQALLADDADGSGQALQVALQAMQQRALLGRIFAPERLSALLRACAAIQEER